MREMKMGSKNDESSWDEVKLDDVKNDEMTITEEIIVFG